jgi:hypothetical protein
MSQSELAESIMCRYKELIRQLENKCLDIAILKRMLDNDTLFDIGNKNEYQCTPYIDAFIQLEQEVQTLPAKEQATIERRIREVLRKTIVEWQKGRRNQDIDRWRTKMVIKEDLIRSILADLAAADANILMAGVGILVNLSIELLRPKQYRSGADCS